jgi:uncharacterized protein with FMN-binding domain
MIKKVLKWTGIVLLVLIAGAFLFGLLGLKEARSLQIETVDLTRIQDGTYTGTYNSYRWTNTVSITIRDHQLISIEPVSPLNGREELTASLSQLIIDSQKNAVDAVSGATASSNAFLKAVENALKNAGT